jgi:hypothetical protein
VFCLETVVGISTKFPLKTCRLLYKDLNRIYYLNRSASRVFASVDSDVRSSRIKMSTLTSPLIEMTRHAAYSCALTSRQYETDTPTHLHVFPLQVVSKLLTKLCYTTGNTTLSKILQLWSRWSPPGLNPPTQPCLRHLHLSQGFGLSLMPISVTVPLTPFRDRPEPGLPSPWSGSVWPVISAGTSSRSLASWRALRGG